MAASDATPFPVKNQAYRVTFPILDNDGDLVTGAAGLDSEISKDSGTFADCDNEATEIATASGIYYLDLTATEMNADTVAIIIKTTTSDAKTTPIVLYPAESADIPVNVTALGGATQSATDLKDFADTGYDPVAHKVQGVVLTDTCTTSSDMRGTDSAALASVCTEARLAELDAANIPADIDAIPTTAMRGTDSAALASVCTEGRLAELDAANLPTDVANVKTDTGSILTDTAEIGAAGAGLSAVPWNAAWDAEVESECNDALVANHLDHLAIHTGTAQAGGAATITLAAGASATTNLYIGSAITIVGGTGAGQTRRVSAYDGGTKIATLFNVWATNPDSSSVYVVWFYYAVPMRGTNNAALASVCTEGRLAELDAANIPADVDAILTDTGTTLPTTLATAQADLDTITGTGGVLIGTDVMDRSGTLDVNTKTITAGAITAAVIATDAIDADAIKADAVTEIQSGLATATNVTTAHSTTDGKVDALVATVGVAGAGLSDLGGMSTTMKAQVESEANDALVALNLDHLMKTGVANNADMTTEVADGTVLSNIMSKTSDTSSYTVGTDSLESIYDASGGGGGGDATAANQVLILEDLVDIKGTGFVKDTNSLVNVTGVAAVNIDHESTTIVRD